MTETRAVLLVHGGAGGAPDWGSAPGLEAAYRDGMTRALRAGLAALSASALDAVEAAIMVLEDDPLFNAGRGAVFTRDGRNELDACLMDGRGRRAGAVAGVTRLKNPVAAARLVMERSGHVLLAGEGADRFAAGHGAETVEQSYFYTKRRWDEHLAGAAAGVPGAGGTVGAAAVDAAGRLAAGSSTGGLSGKRPGRVGDSPVVGAGVYAEDGVAAVSGTGDGEAFLRVVAAYEVIALIKYAGLGVAEAAARVVDQGVAGVGGAGGLIALGADGRFSLPFNTAVMFRGWACADGSTHTAVGAGG